MKRFAILNRGGRHGAIANRGGASRLRDPLHPAGVPMLLWDPRTADAVLTVTATEITG